MVGDGGTKLTTHPIDGCEESDGLPFGQPV